MFMIVLGYKIYVYRKKPKITFRKKKFLIFLAASWTFLEQKSLKNIYIFKFFTK